MNYGTTLAPGMVNYFRMAKHSSQAERTGVLVAQPVKVLHLGEPEETRAQTKKSDPSGVHNGQGYAWIRTHEGSAFATPYIDYYDRLREIGEERI